METFYLFLIIFLFVLAVFDLSVGVSNDAVNFMNSAIGSKAASFKVIMVIAAIGIFVGGYCQARNLPAATFLFFRNYVYFAGCHAHRCGVAGHF